MLFAILHIRSVLLIVSLITSIEIQNIIFDSNIYPLRQLGPLQCLETINITEKMKRKANIY